MRLCTFFCGSLLATPVLALLPAHPCPAAVSCGSFRTAASQPASSAQARLSHLAKAPQRCIMRAESTRCCASSGVDQLMLNSKMKSAPAPQVEKPLQIFQALPHMECRPYRRGGSKPQEPGSTKSLRETRFTQDTIKNASASVLTTARSLIPERCKSQPQGLSSSSRAALCARCSCRDRQTRSSKPGLAQANRASGRRSHLRRAL